MICVIKPHRLFNSIAFFFGNKKISLFKKTMLLNFWLTLIQQKKTKEIPENQAKLMLKWIINGERSHGPFDNCRVSVHYVSKDKFLFRLFVIKFQQKLNCRIEWKKKQQTRMIQLMPITPLSKYVSNCFRIHLNLWCTCHAYIYKTHDFNKTIQLKIVLGFLFFSFGLVNETGNRKITHINLICWRDKRFNQWAPIFIKYHYFERSFMHKLNEEIHLNWSSFNFVNYHVNESLICIVLVAIWKNTMFDIIDNEINLFLETNKKRKILIVITITNITCD